MSQYCFEDDVDVLVELERMVTLARAVLKWNRCIDIHNIKLSGLLTFSSMSHLISMLNPP